MSSNLINASQPLIQESENYAREHLSSIHRHTGENYFDHSLEIANTIREISNDVSLFRVGLLHDLLVKKNGSELLEEAPISSGEKYLISQMYKLRRINIDESSADLDKTLGAFASDSRLLVLRMAHRVNDLRHLDRFEAQARHDICKESLQMYTAIAGRLGFNKWRHEMEDLCFQELYPEVYTQLKEKFDLLKPRDDICINHTQDFLMQRLILSDIEVKDIGFRIKGIYSSYRKMVLKNRFLEDLTDRLALRVVVDTPEDCYRALGVIHANMNPIPGKLKDYIGAPKENGYRSIHTVVYPLPGVSEQPMEIQIRSQDMVRFCEFGLASHGKYKELQGALLSNLTRTNFIRNLEVLKAGMNDPHRFEAALKNYFDEEKIIVFDEEDNPYHLQKPSGVLDLLFVVDKDRACYMKQIKVNGRKVSHDTILKDGDVVEFKYSDEKVCIAKWVDFCHHPYSKRLCKEICT